MVDTTTYVDVNIFVYWLGNHPEFGETACNWIKKIDNSKQKKYVTSSLTLYETLVIIAGLSGKNLRDKAFTEAVVSSMIHIKGLAIEPLTSEDFIKAVDLMKDYNIDHEDALHLAVALRKGAQEIISNDIDFDRTPIRRNL